MCKKSFEMCIALRKGLYVRRVLKCASAHDSLIVLR